MLAKTCGLKTFESAEMAVASGADLLGVILVPGRSRTIDTAECQRIAELVHKARLEKNKSFNKKQFFEHLRTNKYESHVAYYDAVATELQHNGPFLVGVFQNQTVEQVAQIAAETGIDIVQIHDNQDKTPFIETLGVPVISRYSVDDLLQHEEEICTSGQQLLVLLDGVVGGKGQKLDWGKLNEFGASNKFRYILAGGLDCENVSQAMKVKGVIGVDVSSGTETNGVKDLGKIELFVKTVKS